MTSTSSDRFYKLLGDLSPDLLADAFPEAGAAHNATSFRARHAKRIGRMALLYAACAVLLVGVAIYLPALMGALSTGNPPATSVTTPPVTLPNDPPSVVDGWDISKLEEVSGDTVLDCIGSRLSPNTILQVDYRTDTNFTEVMRIEYYLLENACNIHEIHSFASTDWQELQVYLNGKWYRVPTVTDLPGTSLDKLSLENQNYSRHFRIDEQLYGVLPAGNYRAVHAFSTGSETGVVYTPFQIIAPTIDYYLNADGSWNRSLLEGIKSPEFSITSECIEGVASPSTVDLTADRKVTIQFIARHQLESTGKNAYYDHRLSVSSITPSVQLEVEINGFWYAVPMLTAGHSYEVSGAGTLVNIGDSLQVEFPLTEKVFGNLPSGNYRISAEFNVTHQESIRDRESYDGIIYVPFAIENVNSAPPATPDEPVLIPESASRGLKYILQNDGTYAVYGGNCGDTEVVIPSSCNGIPITAIGDSAFAQWDFITSVTLPDTVTSIGNNAFDGCRLLESINIPDSVTSIGFGALMNCESLKSLTLPSGLKRLESYSIFGCSSLTELTIPDSVTFIGQDALAGCYKLTSIVFEDPDGWYCGNTPKDLTNSPELLDWFWYASVPVEKK